MASSFPADSLIGVYWGQLQYVEKAAPDILFKFYMELYDAPQNFKIKSDIIRLTKLYGKRVVFHAIPRLGGFRDVDYSQSNYGALRWCCEKEKEESTLAKSQEIDVDEIKRKIEFVKESNGAI